MVASKTVLAAEQRSKLLPLFAGLWIPPVVRPVVLGDMGIACVDRTDAPTVCSVNLAEFVMFAGDAASPAASYFVETTARPCYVLPSSDDWNRLIRKHAGSARKSTERHSFTADGLEASRLKTIGQSVPRGLKISRFNARTVKQAVNRSWSRGFVENFPSVRRFLEAGIGYAVFDGKEMVSGATSFALYQGTAEVEVNTLPGYRRRGLATLTAARLIGYCLAHQMIPHWDAANEASCGLAEKLGFTKEKTYEVLEI